MHFRAKPALPIPCLRFNDESSPVEQLFQIRQNLGFSVNHHSLQMCAFKRCSRCDAPSQCTLSTLHTTPSVERITDHAQSLMPPFSHSENQLGPLMPLEQHRPRRHRCFILRAYYACRPVLLDLTAQLNILTPPRIHHLYFTRQYLQ